MRLTQNEIDIIKKGFLTFFSPLDHLWIFGSRVDDTKKGGDIDLFIEAQLNDPEEALRRRTNFWIYLQEKLGEQKIDIIIKNSTKECEIYQEARNTGKRLI